MADIIVVGKGPAGISAAAYALRGGASVRVIGKDGGALLKTRDIENYYGFPDVISGEELVQRGIAQAKRLGAEMLEEEVLHLEYDGAFLVKTNAGEHRAKAVVLATGAARQKTNIEGLDALEGRGVSYCAVCDAFFFRGKDVAVLGHGEFAAHEATVLLPVVNSVTLLTNGEKLTAHLPAEVKVIETPVAKLAGGDVLEKVTLADGGELALAGVFIALGVAGSADLARKLGAQTEAGRIVVNEGMATSIPGLYAAGDCTGGLLQVAKAVHQGAVAGMEAVKHARKPQLENEPMATLDPLG